MKKKLNSPPPPALRGYAEKSLNCAVAAATFDE